MTWIPQPKVCPFFVCKKEFMPYRPKQKFCSASCRQEYHNYTRKQSKTNFRKAIKSFGKSLYQKMITEGKVCVVCDVPTLNQRQVGPFWFYYCERCVVRLVTVLENNFRRKPDPECYDRSERLLALALQQSLN